MDYQNNMEVWVVMNRLLMWLFGKMMTIELFRYMRAHKYSEVQKRK